MVEEILNELLLKRARGEESVEISSQKLGDKVTISSMLVYGS